jgi:hypothetical protein
MHYANPVQRAALISGFRELADYLEANPGVPVPAYSDVLTFPADSGCAGMRAEIDAVAELIGSVPRETAEGRHYGVSRFFGPVEYRAVAICKQHGHASRKEEVR